MSMMTRRHTITRRQWKKLRRRMQLVLDSAFLTALGSVLAGSAWLFVREA